jgi:putative copper export protein
VSEDDGHFTKGGYSFNVGNVAGNVAATSAGVEVVHSSTASQAAAIGTELLGQSMFIAVLTAIALFRSALPRRRIPDIAQGSFERACNRMALAGGVLVVAGVATFLTLKTFDLQQSRSTGFSETAATFLSTVDGRFALYRGLLGIGFVTIFLHARKRIFRSERISTTEAGLLVVLILIILDRARVSHAAASHLLPGFSIFVNTLHLVSKEFWVGSLIATTFLLMPILIRVGRASAVADALTQSSKWISIAIGVTGVTGAYIIWLHLKSPTYVLTTEWGTRFVVLSIFAAALAVFRLHNQVIVERLFVADSITTQKGLKKDIASSWRYSIPMEMCIGVAVLFVTSQLIITTPPYPPDAFSMSKAASSQGTRMVLSVHPIEHKQFLVAVTDEKTGAAVPVNDMVVTLQNAEKNIGPVVAESEHRFEGGFTFPRAALSVPGQWTIDIAARRPESYDAVASFQLDSPRQIDESRVGGDERRFGGFEAVLVGAALASILIAVVLYRSSSSLHGQTAAIDPRRGLSAAGFTLTKSIAAGVAVASLVSVAVWASYDVVVKTPFRQSCEANNGAWTQSAPMRDGVVLSSTTMMGCSVGNDHFVDFREYSFFLNRPAMPEHHHH